MPGVTCSLFTALRRYAHGLRYIFEHPLSEESKAFSEIIQNWTAIGAILGAFFLLYRWTFERRDRATDILIELDKQFTDAGMSEGRALVEDPRKYDGLRGQLISEVFHDTAATSEERSQSLPRDKIPIIDKLLRFYVLIYGVRAGKQLPDRSLRVCFRYWLSHYYKPTRRELRIYIENCYPTLHRWLKADCSPLRYWTGRSFFTPWQFGSKPYRRPTRTDIELAKKGKVLVIAGAGISADSGIATYRGEEGYWRSAKPHSLATKSAFEKDPAGIWEWYQTRRLGVQQNQPNEAHQSLVKLAEESREFLLITQNVDNLHERAVGRFSEQDLQENSKDTKSKYQVVHIHGEIFINECEACGFKENVAERPVNLQQVPVCSKCGKIMRPGVVWFDEDLKESQVRRIESFLNDGQCDLVLIIGTSASFGYIVRWALQSAGDGLVLELNPDRSNLTAACDWQIAKRASIALPRLIALDGNSSWWQWYFLLQNPIFANRLRSSLVRMGKVVRERTSWVWRSWK